MSVERALRKVERTAREIVPPSPLPRREKFRVDRRYGDVALVDHQVDAVHELEAALAIDLRFEYMKQKEIEEAAMRFAGAAMRRRAASHVKAFIDEHAQDPVTLTCSFPVEGLTVHREIEVFGVALTPADDAPRPEGMMAGVDRMGPMGCAISSECVGTSGEAMMARAREKVEFALRLLRAGLREHRMIPDAQLRFRLGQSYWFSGGGGGWSSPPDQIITIGLTDEFLELATSTAIATLPVEGGTDIEKSAKRALRWFEQAQLAVDLLMETLFLFFALEAILGDKSEGLKAEGLALRRALLSHKLGEGFTDPGRVYLLYEDVRSAAVHGGEPLDVTDKEVTNFAWDVRRALNEFLTYARQKGFAKRSLLLRALDGDPARAEIKAAFLP